MIFNKYIRITRILFILSSISLISGQTAEELKRFMETYDKIKVEQQAKEVVKKGVIGEKDPEERPVRLLIKPGDIDKYYIEKTNVLRKEIDALYNMLPRTGRTLPIVHFGYNYFHMRDTIPILDNYNVGPDYKLGYGDEIIISVWGQSEQHERKTLERDGTVFVENVGLLYLGGKTLKEAKTYTKDRFSKVYATLKSDPTMSDFEMSLGRVKNINIVVGGHVNKPGSYVINPSVNLSNLLIAAGGVDTTGTLRNLKIQRNQAIIDSIDLYPLISGIGYAKQTRLLNGDIVLVPPRYSTIAMSGAVLRPAYFELKADETASQIIQYAGGLKYNAGKQVLIIRSDYKNQYINVDSLLSVTVTNGDSLFVPFRVEQNLEVTLSTSLVSDDGTDPKVSTFPWYEGLNADILIKIAGLEESKFKIRYIEIAHRSRDDNVYSPVQSSLGSDLSSILNTNLEPFDHLMVQFFESFKPADHVFIIGEVQSPGAYPLLETQEKLSSVLQRSGGLLPSADMASIQIKRDTLSLGSKNGDIMLMPGDKIIVRHRSETIIVEGEVHNPGLFNWQNNMRAKDYLEMAGGITALGDKNHVVYIDSNGEAVRMNRWRNPAVEKGSKIVVSEKPVMEQGVIPDRFQQISSLITSLVSIAILANTTGN